MWGICSGGTAAWRQHSPHPHPMATGSIKENEHLSLKPSVTPASPFPKQRERLKANSCPGLALPTSRNWGWRQGKMVI